MTCEMTYRMQRPSCLECAGRARGFLHGLDGVLHPMNSKGGQWRRRIDLRVALPVTTHAPLHLPGDCEAGLARSTPWPRWPR